MSGFDCVLVALIYLCLEANYGQFVKTFDDLCVTPYHKCWSKEMNVRGGWGCSTYIQITTKKTIPTSILVAREVVIMKVALVSTVIVLCLHSNRGVCGGGGVCTVLLLVLLS